MWRSRQHRHDREPTKRISAPPEFIGEYARIRREASFRSPKRQASPTGRASRVLCDTKEYCRRATAANCWKKTMLSSSFPLTAIWCILVPMGKNSVCAERTCKKEKLAVQQGSPKVVPLRTQRTIHPAVPTQAKTGQNQPFLFVRTTLSPVEQQKIVAAYLRGKGIRAISRELDHGREAVARIVKGSTGAIQNGKELLLGTVAEWIESIVYALRNELDGKMGLTLAQAFEIVQPSGRGGSLRRTFFSIILCSSSSSRHWQRFP